jgi:hypothetical protein
MTLLTRQNSYIEFRVERHEEHGDHQTRIHLLPEEKTPLALVPKSGDVAILEAGFLRASDDEPIPYFYVSRSALTAR